MNLTATRADVAADLTAAGLRAETYMPERVTPPLAVVAPADPYVERPEGEIPFAHVRVVMSVFVIGDKGTASTATDQIDTLIGTACEALADETTEVSAPALVTVNGHEYLGAVLTARRIIRLDT